MNRNDAVTETPLFWQAKLDTIASVPWAAVKDSHAAQVKFTQLFVQSQALLASLAGE